MEIILKLLDWPVLLFIGFGLFFLTFRKEIRKLITRGGLTISWGEGKSFSIDKLPDRLDKNFAPLDDDIRNLEDRVARLEAQKLPSLPGVVRIPGGLRGVTVGGGGGLLGRSVSGVDGFEMPEVPDMSGLQVEMPDVAASDEVLLEDADFPTEDAPLEADRDEESRRIMLEALGEGKYRWRSLDRLSVLAGISKARADELLRGMEEVVMGTGKEGRQLARLRSR